MLTSETITKIMPAFIKAQGQFAPALKQATNPHFKSKYVALDGVIDAVAAPLREAGIAIMQMTDVTERGSIILESRLVHESGEWIGSRYPVHPVKADPQGEGSALTYARRYALMALVGIAPEDDDGNAAVKAVDKIAAPQFNGRPMDGVWEAQSADSQAWLLKVAAETVARVANDPDDALDYLASQNLDTDEKAAVASRLDSKTRTALTKAHNAKRKAA
jgi:hypothetical protein